MQRIVVIYDDLDTPVATVKLKPKGGHGGHNGIRSINTLVKGDYPRIKIGDLHFFSWLRRLEN